MKTTRTIMPLLGAFVVMAGGYAEVPFPDITNGQGEMAGDVSSRHIFPVLRSWRSR